MSSYDGKASLVFSSGDSFAECHLSATGTDGGWDGTLSDILFRTQMVPTPLNPTEHLRLEDVGGQPIVVVTVGDQDGESAQISGEGDPFS